MAHKGIPVFFIGGRDFFSHFLGLGRESVNLCYEGSRQPTAKAVS